MFFVYIFAEGPQLGRTECWRFGDMGYQGIELCFAIHAVVEIPDRSAQLVAMRS